MTGATRTDHGYVACSLFEMYCALPSRIMGPSKPLQYDNGLIYYLGTAGLTQSWINPCTCAGAMRLLVVPVMLMHRCCRCPYPQVLDRLVGGKAPIEALGSGCKITQNLSPLSVVGISCDACPLTVECGNRYCQCVLIMAHSHALTRAVFGLVFILRSRRVEHQ
jgi:hypothetical protein